MYANRLGTCFSTDANKKLPVKGDASEQNVYLGTYAVEEIGIPYKDYYQRWGYDEFMRDVVQHVERVDYVLGDPPVRIPMVLFVPQN